MVLRLLKGVGFGILTFAVLDSSLQVLIFSGLSMQPTIDDRDVGFGEKLTSHNNLRRGDIITALAPDDPSMMICKRIIALEGDKVTYKHPSARAFEHDEELCEFVTLRRFVPRGHVWVEGDNSSRSYDSRMFGPLPMGLIQSRVFIKVYPFKNFVVFAREPGQKRNR